MNERGALGVHATKDTKVCVSNSSSVHFKIIICQNETLHQI